MNRPSVSAPVGRDLTLSVYSGGSTIDIPLHLPFIEDSLGQDVEGLGLRLLDGVFYSHSIDVPLWYLFRILSTL